MTEYGIHDYRPHEDVHGIFPAAIHSREFVSGVRDTSDTNLAIKIERAAQPAMSAGFTPWVSFKLNPKDVVAGKWDAQLEQVGYTIPSNIKLIPWHEPENDMPASDFRAMFARVARLIKGVDPELELVYSAMAYQFRPGSSTTADPEAWFPEDADIYAIDVYSGQSFALDAILPEHPGFARWNGHRPTDKPWAVTERGFITANKHPQRAAAIDREAEWLAKSDCSAYIYWNTEGSEGNPMITLDSTYGEPALKRLMQPKADPVTEDRYEEGFDDGYAAGLTRGQDEGYSRAISDVMAALTALENEENA